MMKKELNYSKKSSWISYLLDHGYTNASADSAADKIMSMDQEIKDAFILWIEQGMISELTVEEFNVAMLMEYKGFSEIASFLMLDWLKREPEQAKWALADFGGNMMIGDKELDEINAAEVIDSANHNKEI